MDPESAFALLGNEMRLDIVRTLGEAGEPLAFSELRERVGARDSGQFNYHLGKLVGNFVADTDEGYRLRHTGLLVYGAILAGSFTGEAGEAPDVTVAVADPCTACDGAIEATYREERMTVACTDCGERFGEATVPPGVFEGYDPEAYPRVFDRYVRELMGRMRRGFCTVCSGRVESRLVAGENGPVLEYDCTRCPEVAHSSVEMAGVDHPAVVAFLHEAGIDLREQPLWAVEALAESDVTGDESGATVTFRAGDGAIRVRVGPDGEVADVIRE